MIFPRYNHQSQIEIMYLPPVVYYCLLSSCWMMFFHIINTTAYEFSASWSTIYFQYSSTWSNSAWSSYWTKCLLDIYSLSGIRKTECTYFDGDWSTWPVNYALFLLNCLLIPFVVIFEDGCRFGTTGLIQIQSEPDSLVTLMPSKHLWNPTSS